MDTTSCMRSPLSGGLRTNLCDSSELTISVHESLEKLQHPDRRARRKGMGFPAVECGVHGYLLQSCLPAEPTNAVDKLNKGKRYLSGSLKGSVAGSLSRTGPTGRNRDVLKLLGKDYCNKLIARELGI